MNIHSHIRQQLYEYLKGELNYSVSEEIKRHLSDCSECRHELEDLELFFRHTGSESWRPSDSQPEEFWNAFTDSTMRRLKMAEKGGEQPSAGFWDTLIDWIYPYRVPAIGVSGIMAVAILILIFWPGSRPMDQPNPSMASLAVDTSILPVDRQFESYLRKSKALLIGVANMDLKNSEPLDLSTELKVSTQLVSEARLLQQQEPIKVHSGQLLGDLEKIQMELANIDRNNPIPHIRTIRQDIREDNLLFKIRMAESGFKQTRFLRTHAIPQEEQK